MRIISGKAKGLGLRAVSGKGTRPTTDKVKEAIFNMIGPYFSGGIALDLYAGTGALGIEAISRGIALSIFVDQDHKSIETIRGNIAHAGFGSHAEIYRNDAEKAIKALAKRGIRCQLVFLDPPYAQKNMDKLLQLMETLRLFADLAVAVIEHEASHVYPERIGGFIQSRRVEYGDTAVSIYVLESPRE